MTIREYVENIANALSIEYDESDIHELLINLEDISDLTGFPVCHYDPFTITDFSKSRGRRFKFQKESLVLNFIDIQPNLDDKAIDLRTIIDNLEDQAHTFVSKIESSVNWQEVGDQDTGISYQLRREREKFDSICVVVTLIIPNLKLDLNIAYCDAG
jgi:hypothetical protein